MFPVNELDRYPVEQQSVGLIVVGLGCAGRRARRRETDGNRASARRSEGELHQQCEVTEVQRTAGIGERGWMTADSYRRHQRHHGTGGGVLDDTPDWTGRLDGRCGALETQFLNRKVDRIRVVVRAGIVLRSGGTRIVVVVIVVVMTAVAVVVMLVSVVGGRANVNVRPEVMTGRSIVAVDVT